MCWLIGGGLLKCLSFSHDVFLEHLLPVADRQMYCFRDFTKVSPFSQRHTPRKSACSSKFCISSSQFSINCRVEYGNGVFGGDGDEEDDEEEEEVVVVDGDTTVELPVGNGGVILAFTLSISIILAIMD